MIWSRLRQLLASHPGAHKQPRDGVGLAAAYIAAVLVLLALVVVAVWLIWQP